MAETAEVDASPANGVPLAALSPNLASTRDSNSAAEPVFPLLNNSAAEDAESLVMVSPAEARKKGAMTDLDEDEAAFARPFQRTTSPDAPSRNGRAAVVDAESDDDDDDGHGTVAGADEKKGQAPGRASSVGAKKSRMVHKMHRFSLYETASRFYIVGGDVSEKRYRILKVARSAGDGESELSVIDDKTVYSQKDMNRLLDTIDDGNKGTGGLKLRCTTWGLLGFIKFTGPWYMILITKKSTVAMLGGHFVYQIEGTELISLTPRGFRTDSRAHSEETRFLAILHNLDLTRSFYYSYSYDITHSLQHNIARERVALLRGEPCGADDDLNSMFVWNSHLLRPVAEALSAPFDWCRPVMHGYIDQAAISVYGRPAHITIMARRSRYFAGARFLKRGVNDLGYVANDVETEQIVCEALTTSFHAPGPHFFASPAWTSYVQHRGSIPLHWTQDNTGVTPKPPIEMNLVDPFYTAAALHFDNLFERYGAPVYVLNLVKARERVPRESKLLHEYTRAVDYLNQFLPDDKKMHYLAWDMSRAAKSRDQDVMGTLENIAEDVLRTTGFFHNGDGHVTPILVQNGVARTNCIDCLDRTNAAQFVIGKRALGHQLHALGILEDTKISYDTDAVNLLTHMYHDHGDTIAVQYGGSQLVNTMETYRKINQWTSHSRDMIESFKRYYNNSFLDGQRQEAYNLFLGNYVFSRGQPMLWDLATDYYLHHEDPRTWLEKGKRHYIDWFTPKFLEERTLPPYPGKTRKNSNDSDGLPKPFRDDYWLEYYRPSTLSSFVRMFPFTMNSTIKYIPFKSSQEGKWDLSPFRVRTDVDGDQHGKKASNSSHLSRPRPEERLVGAEPLEKSVGGRGVSLHSRLPLGLAEKPPAARGLHDVPLLSAAVDGGDACFKAKASALEKSRAAQCTFTQVVHDSLNPTASEAEAEDYARYVSHPQNLPLVVSSDLPAEYDHVDPEYYEYVAGPWQSSASFGEGLPVHEYDYALYEDLLKVGENPLTVTDEDAPKKRYKAYRKWLRGKSLFKQQPVD